MVTDSGMVIYDQVNQHPFFCVEDGAGYLRLSGEMRVDFLQRQTTNDLRLLSVGRPLLTVMTSPMARILDVLLLIDEGESIGIIPLPGRASATVQFLRSRIFFMDKVTLEDDSEGWTHFLIGGKGCDPILKALGVTRQIGLGETARVALGLGSLRVARVGPPYLGDYLLVASRDVQSGLVEVIQHLGAVELSPKIREVIRVENGVPGALAELTEDYTPLEAGLHQAVAQDKGCYTGQEVIARQLTYDKVVQRLVGLGLDREAASGQPLFTNRRQVGTLTSVAESPRFGLIGLGYVRRPDHEVGRILHLAASEDNGTAVVRRLPFEEG